MTDVNADIGVDIRRNTLVGARAQLELHTADAAQYPNHLGEIHITNAACAILVDMIDERLKVL